MATWFDAVHGASLGRGRSIDVDFHTVPANGQVEPLEKHYVSSRSRSYKGILVFLARDATERPKLSSEMRQSASKMSESPS